MLIYVWKAFSIFSTFFERRESLEEEEDLRDIERFSEEVLALPTSASSCCGSHYELSISDHRADGGGGEDGVTGNDDLIKPC